MRTLLKEIIHCRNGLFPGGGNEGEINEFEGEFLKIIIRWWNRGGFILREFSGKIYQWFGPWSDSFWGGYKRSGVDDWWLTRSALIKRHKSLF